MNERQLRWLEEAVEVATAIVEAEAFTVLTVAQAVELERLEAAEWAEFWAYYPSYLARGEEVAA